LSDWFQLHHGDPLQRHPDRGDDARRRRKAPGVLMVRRSRIARFFLVQHTKIEKNTKSKQNIPYGHYRVHTPNIPNGNKNYQHFPFQDPPKCPQILIFICTIWQPSGAVDVYHTALQPNILILEQSRQIQHRYLLAQQKVPTEVNFCKI
jgi:hypothetical protein